VAGPLRSQAERAIALVVEAKCPLCRVELRFHHEPACCPCCSDSYRVEMGRLEIREVPGTRQALRALGGGSDCSQDALALGLELARYG